MVPFYGLEVGCNGLIEGVQGFLLSSMGSKFFSVTNVLVSMRALGYRSLLTKFHCGSIHVRVSADK